MNAKRKKIYAASCCGAMVVTWSLAASAQPAEPTSSPVLFTASSKTILCIVDDSGDMVGADGFSVTPQQEWPVLGYLFHFLACKSCCTWSAFRTVGSKCSGPCTTKVPSLTMTSPLIETLTSAVASDTPDQLLFITNGLDWQAEGGDREFRVEMDVGSMLSSWVLAGKGRSVLAGVVQDNREHRRRRENMVLGLATAPFALGSCDTEPNNLPDFARIRTQMFVNPAARLEGETLSLYPTLGLSGESRLGSVQQTFEIEPDGRVRLPEAVLRSVAHPKATITFVLKPNAGMPYCWGMIAETDAHERIRATCEGGASGAAKCTFALPAITSWPHGILRLRLKTAPIQPAWLAQWVPRKTHALRRTLGSFEAAAEVARPIKVRQQGAQNVDLLVLSAQAR